VLKAHVGRMGEDVPEHQGVVVYSMNDTPIVSRPRSKCGGLGIEVVVGRKDRA